MIPWLLVLLLGGAPGVGHPEEPAAVDTEWLDTARIESVDIHVGNVFDLSLPDEDRFLFRLANRLHRRTRQHVLRRQLLFHQGDLFDPERLAESERLLRHNRYLYEPHIRAEKEAEGNAKVIVEARDVWTLNLGVSYGRKGGTNRTTFDLSDSNFLGLGKDLAIARSFDVDRDTWLLRYTDPQFWGSRTRVGVTWEERSDGNAKALEVERPFFSLDERYAWGISLLDETQDENRYFRGKVNDRFLHDRQRAEIYWGRSKGLRDDGWVRRLRSGFTYLRDRFGAPIPELNEDADVAELDFPVPVLPTPEDRDFSQLWVEWEALENAFEEVRNLDQIRRTEDRNLGSWLRLRAGTSLAALGATRDELFVDLGLGTSLQGDRGWLLEGAGYLESRFRIGGDDEPGRDDAGRFDNVRLGVEGRIYLPTSSGMSLFFARASADATLDADPETQLLLGGDSGLRGYPLRYQDGDKRVLLTVEERFFTHWTLFSLADVGAAIFADAGRSWSQDRPSDPGSGWLADAGVGLRLGMKRSGRGSVLHVDLAVPLGGDDSITGLQYLVSTRQTF